MTDGRISESRIPE